MSLLWLDLGLPRAPNSQAKGVTIPLCHVSSMSHCPMCPSLGVAARTRVFLVSPICPLLMGLGTSLHLKNPGRRRPHSSVTHVPSVPTSHVSGLRGSLGTGDQDESVQELMAWRGVSPMSPHACADVTRGGGGASGPPVPHVPAAPMSQVSVLTGIIKISLKTLLECVRLRTLGRFGLQQVQVDGHYLQLYLWRFAADERVVQGLLDEVAASAAHRCLDPVPMEHSVVELICERG